MKGKLVTGWELTDGINLYLLEEKQGNGKPLSGVYLLKDKKPSLEHLIKGFKQVFLRSKFDSTTANKITYNRYIFFPDKFKGIVLDYVIDLVKTEGNKRGNNFSWLTKLLDIKLKNSPIEDYTANPKARRSRRSGSLEKEMIFNPFVGQTVSGSAIISETPYPDKPQSDNYDWDYTIPIEDLEASKPKSRTKAEYKPNPDGFLIHWLESTKHTE